MKGAWHTDVHEIGYVNESHTHHIKPSSQGHGYDLFHIERAKLRFVSFHMLLSDAKTAGDRDDKPKVSTLSTRCKKAPGTVSYR